MLFRIRGEHVAKINTPEKLVDVISKHEVIIKNQFSVIEAYQFYGAWVLRDEIPIVSIEISGKNLITNSNTDNTTHEYRNDVGKVLYALASFVERA